MMLKSIDEVQNAMEEAKYICERSLATSIYLAQALGKPLLLEGEAGVGKTEVAKVIAEILQTKLIRLQCYDGLDSSHALYEWNYPKQILAIKIAQAQGEIGCAVKDDGIEKTIFSEKFLLTRPLLEAITSDSDVPVVLLIDEIDRSDEEFEAFLLEVLSDFQITIPEIGTIKAKVIPYVIVTSNGTRELHDALKRRCLYHWIDYPSFEKELSIMLKKVPEVQRSLAQQVCALMQKIRTMDLLKAPGIAETLDWAQALVALNKESLDEETIEQTLGCIMKYREDMDKFRQLFKATSETCGGCSPVNIG
ncbi:MAG TPA: MoxR family ATPase [Syntrophales bacterium]|jgi:MoxR-like ATPase|nr:MoxR family ATPase [Syntrophales bacterium]HQA81984.1 MoxR family ATPase [Syntrophales bacterium]